MLILVKFLLWVESCFELDRKTTVLYVRYHSMDAFLLLIQFPSFATNQSIYERYISLTLYVSFYLCMLKLIFQVCLSRINKAHARSLSHRRHRTLTQLLTYEGR